MDVSVVIVSREKKQLLSRAIDSIISQNFPRNNFEIIIVDDGSKTDDLNSLVEGKKKIFKNIKYVRQKPTGLAAGRNTGTKNSNSKIIAFTDNDVIADKNWLKEIVSAFRSDVVGVEGKIRTDSPRGLFTNAPENLNGEKFIGANSAYLKEVIEKAGFYNESMNFWREDSEFAFRAMDFGEIVFAEKAEIHHPLRKDSPTSIFKYLSFLRNEWIIFFKHPKKTVHYFCKGVIKDLMKTIGFYLISGVIVFGLISNNLLISLFAFLTTVFVILVSLSRSQKSNYSEKSFLKEALLFGLLTWLNFLLYPVFLVIGLVKAIIFILLKKN